MTSNLSSKLLLLKYLFKFYYILQLAVSFLYHLLYSIKQLKIFFNIFDFLNIVIKYNMFRYVKSKVLLFILVNYHPLYKFINSIINHC